MSQINETSDLMLQTCVSFHAKGFPNTIWWGFASQSYDFITLSKVFQPDAGSDANMQT